ncbi:monooxygenase [Planomonospora sphaerica]|uniref:Monooxygenase n=1 Tax=Planomonospora sphaerica TaxID=161355 RepID=A0A171DIN6_9ACTN|nr:cytochrome P450 [Planomonospora sphaerica]GAT68757.1 monooxygenase [Planomonospora sphaerica]
MSVEEAARLETIDLLDPAQRPSRPYALYQRLRERGPVVWLPGTGAWAITQHAAVRQALSDHEDFVPLPAAAGGQRAGTMDVPARVEAVLGRELAPYLIRPYLRVIRHRIEERLLALAGRRQVDAIGHLIWPVVAAVAADLAHDEVPALPAGAVDADGPVRDRAAGQWPLDAAGEVLVDGLGNVLATLAAHPPLGQSLRADPGLVPKAVAECLRLEPPVHWVARWSTRRVRLGDSAITLPMHARVLVVVASAYRDERHWPDPQALRPERLSSERLPVLAGPPGRFTLLGLYAEALIGVLLEHLAHLEPAGSGRLRIRQAHQGHHELPLAFFLDPRSELLS